MQTPGQTRVQRLRGGLLGLLIGDALGVPYEFHHADDIPAWAEIDMVPPTGFARAHRGVPPGTWSDDGAQALVLLESLQRAGRLDLDDVAQGLLDWLDDGHLAVDGRVFDVGLQTAEALGALRRGIPAAEAGRRDERANGNGSLMRVLPLALWHTGSDADLVAAAMTQSVVTHGHVRAQVCCALYCLWARQLLAGRSAAQGWDAAATALLGLLADDPEARDELVAHVLERVDAPVRGSGYVVDCLLATRALLLRHASYADVVRGAVALGDDTDTTAAVAGGLAGIRDGEQGIPTVWLAALRGRDLLDPLLRPWG